MKHPVFDNFTKRTKFKIYKKMKKNIHQRISTYINTRSCLLLIYSTALNIRGTLSNKSLRTLYAVYRAD